MRSKNVGEKVGEILLHLVKRDTKKLHVEMVTASVTTGLQESHSEFVRNVKVTMLTELIRRVMETPAPVTSGEMVRMFWEVEPNEAKKKAAGRKRVPGNGDFFLNSE